MGKRRYSKSFELVLSAISCAFAVIFLLVGFFWDLFLGVGYVFAIISLMVPLSKRFYLGAFLAYAGTVVLALVLGAAARFWDLVPFIMFFGLHPLVNALQVRFNVNKWLSFFIKAVWFDFALWVSYILIFGGVIGGEYAQNAFFEFVNKYILWVIFIGGTVFFIAYDFVMFKFQIAINKLVCRIRR